VLSFLLRGVALLGLLPFGRRLCGRLRTFDAARLRGRRGGAREREG
jgi:hypothetical protein